MTSRQNAPRAETQRPQGGEWLFRQGGLVLGPMPTEQIIEKLYAGSVDGSTEITPLGQNQYRPLAELDPFKIDLAKAQAKLRVDAMVHADRAERVRRRNLRLGIVAVVAASAGTAAASAARYLAVHTPFKSEPIEEISVEPPIIGLAKVRSTSEELVDYPLSTGDPAHRKAAARPSLALRSATPARSDGPSDPRPLPTP